MTDFAAALRDATAIAARSPSSHNCQPWGLGLARSPQARAAAAGLLGGTFTHYLTLALDREHELTALPAHAMEMLLSCGAYWGVLLDALTALGWRPATAGYPADPADPADPGSTAPDAGAVPGPQWPSRWSPLCVAGFDPGDADLDALAALREVTRRRRTNRGRYQPAGAGLAALGQSAVTEAVELRHLRDDQARAVVARLVGRYAGRDFACHAAWRETYSFIRSPADALRRGDGFTLEQLFGPMPGPRRLATNLALAPATMRVLSLAGYHRLLAARLAAVVGQTPALAVLSFRCERPGRDEAVRAGGALARYWLAVTGQGLALHPVSVVLQHDDARQALQRRLGLPGRAFFLARLGRPASTAAPTARRPSAAGWRPY